MVDRETYMLGAERLTSKKIRQNEVLRTISGSGVYKNKFMYMEDKKIPIYFKKKKLTAPNGSRLKIHYAHLGYYKRMQIVIYSKKDFEITRE